MCACVRVCEGAEKDRKREAEKEQQGRDAKVSCSNAKWGTSTLKAAGNTLLNDNV